MRSVKAGATAAVALAAGATVFNTGFDVTSMVPPRQFPRVPQSPTGTNEDSPIVAVNFPRSHQIETPQLSASIYSPNFDNSSSDIEESFRVQLRQQKEIERFERENKELRKLYTVLSNSGKPVRRRDFKKSLIDMYSEVLEEMGDFDSGFEVEDHLPRIVGVGDQSAGKTSVLESIIQARVFPRGSGQMMTRSPVMVTLSEGPYHVAQFKDSDREFDLSQEADLRALRQEIELRMTSAVDESATTISSELIGLNVKGPGLQRMVLVDLPGIISTETKDLATNTKSDIESISRKFMSNRNAIILCVQDGSVDAERSLVTDLVSSVDPTGQRTVFVLTKADLVEERNEDVKRLKQILEGKRFPMKALGYFAVVTGTGNRTDRDISKIKAHEDEFFSKSSLLKSGVKPSQLSTHNLTIMISDCFWKMVKASIEQEADRFKAKLFNLESQWKNKFPSSRELDRDELFEKGKYEVLDQVLQLGHIDAKHWDDILFKKLFQHFGRDIFDSIYFPVIRSENEDFRTMIDIQLHHWAEKSLPSKSIEIARETIMDELHKIWGDKKLDTMFEPLREAMKSELRTDAWQSGQVPESLKFMQSSSLNDKTVPDHTSWKNAARFMEDILTEEKSHSESYITQSLGPGFWDRWLKWKSLDPDQWKRQLINSELDVILKSDSNHGCSLSQDEVTTIRKNISHKDKKLLLDNSFIRDVWNARFRLHSIEKSIARCRDCKTFFHHYQRGFREPGVSCDDIVLFWRLQRTLQTTVQGLRQQILNVECRRLDAHVKGVLDEISSDKDRKRALVSGPQVELAEKVKRVRSIYQKLENFAAAVRNEK